MSERFLNDRVELHCGDCLAVLPTLEENSIDAVVCDPPYHLTSIVKRFGSDNCAPAKSNGATGVYKRASSGFMGRKWDGGDIAFQVATWAAVYRVLKPGGHLLAFGGTRTFHRMACAIEDAGFEIRDTVMWLYGSGFPKSHDISKHIDRALGRERGKIRVPASKVRNSKATGGGRDGMEEASRPWIESAMVRGFHEAVSDEAERWAGWGTGLKPACEPIVLARKPLSEPTIAANVLRWNCGALNIDACRVAWLGPEDAAAAAAAAAATGFADSRSRGAAIQSQSLGKESRDGTNYDPDKLAGRWPANVIHDGSDEVLAAFPESSVTGDRSERSKSASVNGTNWLSDNHQSTEHLDSGSAARFFYSSKADSDDRLGSKHPTVKPLDLMQYLVRLVTPPRGLVLDPFAGTGTTGEAAWREGFSAVLIEREKEYQNDIRRRMKLALAGPDERARESIKEKLKGRPQDHGPLFGGSENMRGGGADRFTASSPINWTDRNDEMVSKK